MTESITYMDDELSYGVYELRWKSHSESNPSKPIVSASAFFDKQTLPVTSDHEFFQVVDWTRFLRLVFQGRFVRCLLSPSQEGLRGPLPLLLLVPSILPSLSHT